MLCFVPTGPATQAPRTTTAWSSSSSSSVVARPLSPCIHNDPDGVCPSVGPVGRACAFSWHRLPMSSFSPRAFYNYTISRLDFFHHQLILLQPCRPTEDTGRDTLKMLRCRLIYKMLHDRPVNVNRVAFRIHLGCALGPLSFLSTSLCSRIWCTQLSVNRI